MVILGPRMPKKIKEKSKINEGNKNNGENPSKDSEKSNNKLEKAEFVELDYVGKVKGGNIFDTNVKDEAKKIGINIESRPVAICLGQNMILSAIDNFLIGKEIGKEYKLELKSDKAFGERKQKFVKTMPMKVFERHGVSPRRGMTFNFDNKMGTIKAVSGGRVIVDFNNPIAGKDVEYKLRPKKKVTSPERKVRLTIKTLLNKEPKFEIKNGKAIIDPENDKQLAQILKLYKDKLGEIVNMEVTVKGQENSESKNK